MAIIKTRREISYLKKAATIANSCIPIIEESLKKNGVTEKEISWRVRKNIYKKGGGLSFRTLVASGKRSAMIHPKPATTKRKVSGIGYVDFGASYRGYKTDVTVPFVKGKIKKHERKIVETVLRAYKIALKTWRFGKPIWKVHRKSHRYIESKGFEMRHWIGHGVGKRIHEMPKRWREESKTVFQNGMVFTIEPGAYKKNVGGSRLENTFLVSGKKLKALTKSKLIEV